MKKGSAFLKNDKCRRSKKRNILMLLICLGVVLCVADFGRRREQSTEKYILNTEYKETVRQLINANGGMQGNADVTYIITECDGVSYIKEQSDRNNEKEIVAAIRDNNK